MLPEVEISIIPEEKGVEALSRQIKLTGRAYPLFDIGFLILKKPERYNVRFDVIKKADGTVAQAMFVCSLDDTLWLSEQEATNYVLDRHFSTFYQAEKIPTDPPKGVFTFVAQCGMSGIVLGPPNYHDYNNKLRKLHAERYAHLPFEVYKSRVKIVRDEAVVKKWLEDQSFTTEYVCLNIPETVKLGTREEVEKHFRATHLPNVIQSVETYTVSGVAARSLACQPVQTLVRHAWEDQRRFPLRVVTTLSQMFASLGLQFFKVNKTLTHVAVSRPHFLDVNVTPVSEGIRRIIGFINSHPGSNRRKLLEGLIPASSLVAPAPAPAAEVAEAVPPAGESVAAPAAVPAPAAPPTIDALESSPEAGAIISNLHWLIHQGHVIEFANGVLETAKPPLPRPPRPAPRPAVSAPGPASEPAASKEASAAVPTPETGEVPTVGAPVVEAAEAEAAGASMAETNPAGAEGVPAAAPAPVETTPEPEPVAPVPTSVEPQSSTP